MIENSGTPFNCPVCGKTFESIHEYAAHMMEHSKTEKKKKEEEERQRRADQKKVDLDRVTKLRNVYEDAFEAYSKAKEKYEEEYNETIVPTGMFNDLFDVFAPNRWRF